MELGKLSAAYESNGDLAIVSTGEGDRGGVSYGAYQLASNCGSVDAFLGWGLRQEEGFYKDYARALQSAGPINSDEFISKWQELGTVDPNGFMAMQHDYIKYAYYDVACSELSNQLFDVNIHSRALRDVVFSAAVQYGPGEVVNLFKEAMQYVPGWEPDWNLSYVNDIKFDWDLINGVYEQRKLHPWNYEGNPDWLRENLVERFDAEKAQALEMFSQEMQERGL